MSIPSVRTPDARFENLPGYSFSPNYVDDLPGYEGLRLHYVDEGPRDAAATFVCLHGQPTWSFLYRKMIPVFLEAGHRVIAPDLFGFGRSDKPVDDDVYTYHFHRNTLLRLLERLNLPQVVLVVQDWGGLLGLTLPMAFPDRVSHLLVMNTALPTGLSAGPGFESWKAYNSQNPDLDVAKLMRRAVPGISPEEAAAYAAPFPDIRHKAGVRRFPDLVMVRPEMEGVETSKQAIRFLKRDWTGRSFMAIGMQDPVLGPPIMRQLHKVIRGCPEAMEVPEAGHFVQEHGEPIARAALDSFADSL